MRVYFAGVNQIQYCEAFAGRHVMETFADVRQLMDRYRPTFAGVALDCGAFTALTSGKQIDLAAYGDFVAQHGGGYDWCASLDSIDGGVTVNIENWKHLAVRRGLAVMPTFHQGEPWSVLNEYLGGADIVGLGFQRPIKDARPWLDDCFSRIPSGRRVHGWAMTSYCDYPFQSVDSSTWLFEVKALLSVEGQGSEAMRCLTNGELIEIVQKKYERLPARVKWDGVRQGDLFSHQLDVLP